MARNTKRGKCELCGEMANVGMNHGTAACTKCTHIQAALANRPQAVARAARSMGKAEDLIKALIPAGGSLAVQVTATLLQEISGIVGYDGEEPAELVEAVRKRAERPCASCDSEDVLHEIREIVGYVPEQSDKGLADAVRALAAVVPAGRGDLDRQWTGLVRACGLDPNSNLGLDVVAAAAVQTIAYLTHRRDTLLDDLTEERVEAAALRSDIARLSSQTHSESEQVAALRDELSVVRAELTLVEQTHDEWEQRAMQAEQNVEALEAELRNAESAPIPCTDNTLLDIALAVIREEHVPAWKIASLIEAARRAA